MPPRGWGGGGVWKPASCKSRSNKVTNFTHATVNNNNNNNNANRIWNYISIRLTLLKRTLAAKPAATRTAATTTTAETETETEAATAACSYLLFVVFWRSFVYFYKFQIHTLLCMSVHVVVLGFAFQTQPQLQFQFSVRVFFSSFFLCFSRAPIRYDWYEFRIPRRPRVLPVALGDQTATERAKQRRRRRHTRTPHTLCVCVCRYVGVSVCASVLHTSCEWRGYEYG